MATRAIAVGERLHHLKVFFSNRAVYAQVVRKTDGHVRASTPPRAVSPRARPRPPPARARTERAICELARSHPDALVLDPASRTPPPAPAASPQILAAANTQEREMRETLQNRSDKRAAAVVGRAIAARAKSADVPAVHFAKPRGAQRKRFHGKLKALIDAMREAGLPLNVATLAPR